VITAVDTSILIDILAADSKHLPASKSLLSKCLLQGRVVACPIVWSELRPLFDTDSEMNGVMDKMAVDFDMIDAESASLAGETWKVYRSKGGPKERIISDFLIGAHASVRAHRFITRDRGFYRCYFRKLTILEP